MKRIFIIFIASYACILLEYMLFNIFGTWGKPDFLFLLVVFFNLYSGIRFSLIAAVLVGLWKEAYAPGPFGVYLFSYVCVSYLTTWFMSTAYQRGSRDSRRLLIVVLKAGHLLIQYVLMMMLVPHSQEGFWQYIFFPEWVLTMIVANSVFDILKQQAKRLAL